MKRLVISLIVAVSALSLKATAMFPFFVDIAPNYREGTTQEFVDLGIDDVSICCDAPGSFYPTTFSQVESFYNDVLPDGVLKEVKTLGDYTLAIYTYVNAHHDATIVTDAVEFKIYVLGMPDGSFKAGYSENTVEL